MVRRFSVLFLFSASILLSFGCSRLESLNSDLADSSSGGGGSTTPTLTLTYDIVDDAEGADELIFGDVPVFSAVATNFDLTLVDGVVYKATWQLELAGAVNYVRDPSTGNDIVDPLDVAAPYNDSTNIAGVSLLHTAFGREEKARLVIRDASNALIVQSNQVTYNKIPPCKSIVWNSGAGSTFTSTDPFEFSVEDDPMVSNFYDLADVSKLTIGIKAGVATSFTYSDEGTRTVNGAFSEWNSIDVTSVPAGPVTIRAIIRNASDEALCSLEESFTAM